MPPPVDSDVNHAPDWAVQPERSNRFLLRLMAWIALFLGRPVARLLLYPICLYFLVFSARARSASRQYLSRALDRRAGWADLFRHYHTFASTILDRVFLLAGRFPLFDVRVHGAEIIDGMTADGRGCILLGAHFGSFEAIRSAGKLRVPKVGMVMYEDNARKTSEIFEIINPDLRMDIIALGRVDSILKIDAALERGEAVGMLADRMLQGGDAMSCDFFGESAWFPTGPIRIARILKKPVALMFGVYRGGNRYDIHIEKFSEPGGMATEERVEAVENMVRHFAARLEYYCRLAPYNWFNFYDFWRA